jgi:hypothetical protein
LDWIACNETQCSAEFFNLCKNLVDEDPNTRITAQEIIEILATTFVSTSLTIESDKVTVKFKRERSKEEEIFRLPGSATIGDFLEAAEGCQKGMKSVVLSGRIIPLSSRLAEVCNDEMLEIVPKINSETSVGQKLKVKFKSERSSQVNMMVIRSSATIGEFLGKATKDIPGVSVKIDDCFVARSELVSDYSDEIIVISQTPYEDAERLSRLSSVSRRPSPELDLVFVMDATGSMSAAIKAVHDYALTIAHTFRINQKLQLRIACICYRDPIDSRRDIHGIHQFTESILEFQKFVERVKAVGGGDDPEDYVGAMNAILSLEWRPTANRGIVWIADTNAHGFRYSGSRKHQEEESKFEPLVRMLIDKKMKFQGFSVGGGANKTFTEMQNIYRAMNPTLFFKFQDFKSGSRSGSGSGSVESKAKTMGDMISTTLRTCAHEFIDPIDDHASRHISLGTISISDQRDRTNEPPKPDSPLCSSARRLLGFGSSTVPRSTLRRSVTFVV